MKNLLLSLITIFALSLLQAQENTHITITQDDMTGEAKYTPHFLTFIESDTEWFSLSPYIKVHNSHISCSTIIIVSKGLGSCIEDSTLMIMFEDGSLYTIKSWNKFNCKGRSYMDLTPDLIAKLKTHTPTKVRFTNGHSYDSMTSAVKAGHQAYFKKMFKSIDAINKDLSGI